VSAGRRIVAACLLALASMPALTAVTADTERERRLAEQIVPQLMAGDAAWLATPHHERVLALYTEPGKPTRKAIVIVHGLGVSPDWNLIGVLRTELADLGFATLSVQMPVLAADAPREDYGALFPDARERLDAAVAWLRAKRYAAIGVVSHSLGGAMVNDWLAKSDATDVRAWVPVGMLVDFAVPPRLPVLDVVAEHDMPPALAASKARARALPRDACSRGLVVAGTDHYFDGSAKRLAKAIAPFLARALEGACG
jgi:alpha/beta superfamily hydrolase